MRNHDTDRSYDLTVTVRDGEGGVAFERDPSVAPDDIVEWTGAPEPGGYEVRAAAATGPEAVATCDADASPSATALVELGDWQVSATDGL